jgi:DNA-binding response OmpR family regulator
MTAHILLVEDEIKLAKFIQLELGYEGYEISVVHDGVAGLTAARELQVDLIILDWMLPDYRASKFVAACGLRGIKSQLYY